MIFKSLAKAIAGAALAVCLIGSANAATGVVCGGAYSISSGEEFTGSVFANGGAGTCLVQFDSTEDPLGAGALATIGPISLKDWGNLTWSWVSTFDDFVLETAVISPGTNLLATVFHSPFDLGQWLKFEWTSSIQGKTFDFEVSAVPLPPALLLFGSAMAGIGFLSRKRKKAEPSLV